MKFLVIGASGFVGRHVFQHIKALQYEVVGTQSSTKLKEFATFNLLKDRIKDCIDAGYFNSKESTFGIICAAVSQIDRCLTEKKISYEINVKNTSRLISDMQSLNIIPVFLSTDSVYDGARGGYTEDDQPQPINEYGRQKVEIERYLIDNIPSSIILRLSKIVGDTTWEKHPFAEWYINIKDNKPIACIEGQVFSPTFVKDIAKAVVLACDKRLSGLYNVANKEFLSRTELAKQFLSFLKKDNSEIISKPQSDFNFADLRPEKTYLDSTKFMKMTGMQFTSMQEVFRSFIKNLPQLESVSNV